MMKGMKGMKSDVAVAQPSDSYPGLGCGVTARVPGGGAGLRHLTTRIDRRPPYRHYTAPTNPIHNIQFRVYYRPCSFGSFLGHMPRQRHSFCWTDHMQDEHGIYDLENILSRIAREMTGFSPGLAPDKLTSCLVLLNQQYS